MADGPSGRPTKAKAAARGKTKAQKKQTSTEANPYLDPYKFTDEEDTGYQSQEKPVNMRRYIPCVHQPATLLYLEWAKVVADR